MNWEDIIKRRAMDPPNCSNCNVYMTPQETRRYVNRCSLCNNAIEHSERTGKEIPNTHQPSRQYGEEGYTGK